MEENQIQSQDSFTEFSEPAIVDNSYNSALESDYQAESYSQGEGESFVDYQDPSNSELILGKFKSVDELSKAYEELQRYQGLCSEELGILRKNSAAFNEAEQNLALLQKYQQGYETRIKQDKEKYNAPEYFQDPTFREMYAEVFKVLGGEMDTDKFVNLLDNYVNSRLLANEKKKAAKNETEKILNSMDYNKNSKSSFTSPKKKFDEMTPKEIDELLDRLI